MNTASAFKNGSVDFNSILISEIALEINKETSFLFDRIPNSIDIII